ncbi:MAG: aldose 1-epimerase [Alphaproteobacteria bacterium]|nr:aldose 1-epimerase [Alphaproteobacteria bacterium]
MIVLESGAARLELCPEIGGAIAGFSVDGRDILRPMAKGATDALQVSSFPLVPFCNRVPRGRFTVDGRDVSLTPNLAGHPHALHGQGWRAAWTVNEAKGDRAVLSYDHAPSDWPWAYRAEQRFGLTNGVLRVDLSVTNTSDTPMPAGLGLHPYFPRRPGEVLKASVDGVWMVDQDVLPTVLHKGVWGPDWAGGAPVEGHDELIDHCYTGWTQTAALSAPGLPTTTLTASPDCRWLHVYVPPGEAYYCVEPCASRPDPFRAPDAGLVTLAPGESHAIWMEIATG